MSGQYNLLEEKWIPVLFESGDFGKVSALEALENAHQIRQLVPNNPMDRVGILRFLIALLYWSRGSPSEVEQANPTEPFPKGAFDKLRENRDCFNLLGNGRRFYQDEECKNDKRQKSINYLLQEIPTGTNFWHFRHSTDFETGLCASCCAMGLLRLPIFTTSGGSGLSPGINGRPPIYVLPLGESLLQTLSLSWKPIQDETQIGTPTWESPNLKLQKEAQVPFLTGLTWLPRRVWINESDHIESTCFLCGQKKVIYQSCLFIGNGTLSSINPVWDDPHVLFRRDQKGEAIPIFSDDSLGSPARSSGQWANITKALDERFNGKTQNVFVVKFATVQNDKYLEAVEETISIPKQKTSLFTEYCKSWIKACPKTTDKTSRSRSLSKAHGASIRPDIEHHVSSRIPSLLKEGEPAWQEAAKQYEPLMEALSGALAPGNTVKSLEKRQYISSLKPQVQLKKKQEEKKS